MNEYIVQPSWYWDDYITHHGIKGQKWGVRRFQNPDGSVTAAGAKRYYGLGERVTNGLSNHYKKTYKMTDAQAKAEAEKTKKFLRNVAIGAGVAIGVGVGVYAARKIGRSYFDTAIKAGKTLQTLSDHPDRMKSGQAFYAAYRKGDKLKYLGGWGEKKVQTIFGPMGSGEYKKAITAPIKEKTKIAGYRSGKKTFDSLMKNNSEFRDLFNKEASSNDLKDIRNQFGKKDWQYKHYTFKNNYERFNRFDLLNNDPSNTTQQRLQKIFYDSLKNKGYAGVKDFNDNIKSGYNTKAIMLFDKSKIGDQSVRQLSADEVAKGQRYMNAMLKVDEYTKPKYVAAGTAYISSLALLGKAADTETKYERRR